mgnify:CR=1 FL=1
MAVLESIRHACPWLGHVFARVEMAGRNCGARSTGWASGRCGSSTVRHGEGLRGPPAPMGGRTHLRLARALPQDWEKSIASPEAWIDIAHIRLTDASQGTGIVDWIPSQALRFDPGHQMGEGQWSARMRRNSGAKRRTVFSYARSPRYQKTLSDGHHPPKPSRIKRASLRSRLTPRPSFPPRPGGRP